MKRISFLLLFIFLTFACSSNTKPGDLDRIKGGSTKDSPFVEVEAEEEGTSSGNDDSSEGGDDGEAQGQCTASSWSDELSYLPFFYVVNYLEDTIQPISFDPMSDTFQLEAPIDLAGGPWDMTLSNDQQFLFVTTWNGKRIFSYEVDQQTGQLTYRFDRDPGLEGDDSNSVTPLFIHQHPEHPILYSHFRYGPSGERTDYIQVFGIEQEGPNRGGLQEIGGAFQPSSSKSADLVLSPDNRYMFWVNFSDAKIEVLNLSPDGTGISNNGNSVSPVTDGMAFQKATAFIRCNKHYLAATASSSTESELYLYEINQSTGNLELRDRQLTSHRTNRLYYQQETKSLILGKQINNSVNATDSFSIYKVTESESLVHQGDYSTEAKPAYEIFAIPESNLFFVTGASQNGGDMSADSLSLFSFDNRAAEVELELKDSTEDLALHWPSAIEMIRLP